MIEYLNQIWPYITQPFNIFIAYTGFLAFYAAYVAEDRLKNGIRWYDIVISLPFVVLYYISLGVKSRPHRDTSDE